jgi:hypothetical protein
MIRSTSSLTDQLIIAVLQMSLLVPMAMAAMPGPMMLDKKRATNCRPRMAPIRLSPMAMPRRQWYLRNRNFHRHRRTANHEDGIDGVPHMVSAWSIPSKDT